MSRRKDNYRAALRRGPETPRAAKPQTAKVTTLRTRYARVTIELSPELTSWTGPPAVLLGFAGDTLFRAVGLLRTFLPLPLSRGR